MKTKEVCITSPARPWHQQQCFIRHSPCMCPGARSKLHQWWSVSDFTVCDADVFLAQSQTTWATLMLWLLLKC